jgi:hypothetical protein
MKYPVVSCSTVARLVAAMLMLAGSHSAYGQATVVRDLRLFFMVPALPPPSCGFTCPPNHDLRERLHSQPRPTLRRDMILGATLPVGVNVGGKFALVAAYRASEPGLTSLSVPTFWARAPRYVSEEPLQTARLSPGFERIVRPSNATFSDRYLVGSPAVRIALDGSPYEAVRVSVDRNGTAFSEQFYGYRMGLVSSRTADTANTNEREHYDLVSLPEPSVEGIVTEYIYRPAVTGESRFGHFFYAASEAERTALDQVADWMRSGREFKSGGYLPVCRFFYRPPSGAQATHFYTARADECEQFKTLAGFTYEGVAFRASLPRPASASLPENDPARCPEKSVPLWRVFNGNVPGNNAPNHRYVLDRSEAELMMDVNRWSFEGISLCVPQ